MVPHPGEGDGGVERNPPGREHPVKEVVELLPDQEAPLRDQVPHL